MKQDKEQNQPRRRKRPLREGPELRVVGIDVNPAPDAQERLRRLFTILARLAEDDDDTTRAGQDSRASGEEGDEQGE